MSVGSNLSVMPYTDIHCLSASSYVEQVAFSMPELYQGLGISADFRIFRTKNETVS